MLVTYVYPICCKNIGFDVHKIGKYSGVYTDNVNNIDVERIACTAGK